MKKIIIISSLLFTAFLLQGCFLFLHPRCKIENCEVKYEHYHGGQMFRGSHFWKKQNPRIGEEEKPKRRTVNGKKRIF